MGEPLYNEGRNEVSYGAHKDSVTVVGRESDKRISIIVEKCPISGGLAASRKESSVHTTQIVLSV